jgi:hypothetical protein
MEQMKKLICFFQVHKLIQENIYALVWIQLCAFFDEGNIIALLIAILFDSVEVEMKINSFREY